jgi:hypothetical protein
VISPVTTRWLPFATIITVAVVTLISALGAVRSARGSQKLAAVTSVAEAAQRALLRPLPRQVGPLERHWSWVWSTSPRRLRPGSAGTCTR